MEIYLTKIWDYFLNVLLATYNQLFVLFVPLFILILFLNFSATFITRLSVRFWGRNIFLYCFGWLGCSVHELSHAFFAIIFGHKITEIELFKPNNSGESLGHVSHSFNNKSIYQKIGNFFIGISPLLSGGIVLYFSILAFYGSNITELSTFRITPKVFSNLDAINQIGVSIWSILISFCKYLFTGINATLWKSALLVYILYSTGSSMSLSRSDISGASSGFIWVIVFLIIFNLATLWIGDFVIRFILQIGGYISGFYFLLIVSVAANLLFILIMLLLNLFKNLFVSR